MTIAMSFDELSALSTRLHDTAGRLADVDAQVPTDAGTLGGDDVAAAAASFAAATERMRDAAHDRWRQLGDAVSATGNAMHERESALSASLARVHGELP
ncbi:hypothetical protein [Microbacterium sp. CIAB417]|uniref:hypothetical protein n=1 Tax=Microbacterium sp. CIAB417 TaxID=2860287 RepID=UPI001FAE035D|nr:hypothetical protein [Microbacterium sp. CIAB417]